jgi:hypothetical protein
MGYNNQKQLLIFLAAVVLTVMFSIYIVGKAELPCCIQLKNVIYHENVFSTRMFALIKRECSELHNSLTKENGIAIGRETVMVPDESLIAETFYNRDVMHRLGRMIGTRCISRSPQPIEYRLYKTGSSMPWHRDDVITNMCPQIEIVFTVFNTSDSLTEWLDETKNKTVQVKSESNSMIITQGKGAIHRVTELTRGQRAIIKIAYDLQAEITSCT